MSVVQEIFDKKKLLSDYQYKGLIKLMLKSGIREDHRHSTFNE